jgi:hypothetical protein
LKMPAVSRLMFWGAAVFSFVMAVLPHPPELPGSPSDKIQHITAFATLGLLGGWAYRETSPLRLALRLSLFGAFIELVQLIPALHRNSDVLDWAADTAAASIILIGLNWWRSRSRRND